jgi:hypothetical protein
LLLWNKSCYYEIKVIIIIYAHYGNNYTIGSNVFRVIIARFNQSEQPRKVDAKPRFMQMRKTIMSVRSVHLSANCVKYLFQYCITTAIEQCLMILRLPTCKFIWCLDQVFSYGMIIFFLTHHVTVPSLNRCIRIQIFLFLDQEWTPIDGYHTGLYVNVINFLFGKFNKVLWQHTMPQESRFYVNGLNFTHVWK